MKREIFSTLFALVLVLTLGLVTAVPAEAQDSVPDRVTAITTTADRLVDLQSTTDYGWDWIVTELSAHSANPSAYNMYGVVILGLLDAYEITNTESYLAAATGMADHMTSGEASNGDFYKQGGDQEPAGAYDYQFLMQYAEVSDDPAYSDYAIALWDWNKANTAIFASPSALNDKLLGWAGSDPGAAAWQLAAFGEASRLMGDGEFATGCADLIVADLAEDGEGWLVGDHMAEAECLEFLNELDSATYSSTIGGIITDLVEAQQADGCWNDGFAGTFQDTAYAVRALAVHGGTDGLDAARKGAAWLVANQLDNGGWIDDSGDTSEEYSEQDAEGLRALIATAAPVTIGEMGYYSIQSAIDSASPEDTITVAAGTYNELLSVNEGVSIVGAGVSQVTINVSGLEGNNNSGIYVSADNVSLQGFTLVCSPASSLPRYGIKFGAVSGGSVQHVLVRDIFRSGFDFLGTTNTMVSNIESRDNGGHGISLVDCNNIALSNITTSGSGWQAVSVATWGHYTTLGTSGIVFSGTNSFGNVFQLEEGDYNNPGSAPSGEAIITYSTNVADGADVTVQASDFGYALHGDQDDGPDQNRVWFSKTLAEAQTVISLAPVSHLLASGIYVESLTDRAQLYISPGCEIQDAINAATAGDTINVAAGTYLRKIVINKALTVKSTDRAEDTIIQGVSTSDYYLVDIQHSDVTFDGFTVTNPTTEFGSDVSGILVQSRGELVSNVHILNNIVTQVRSETGTPSMFGATGINIGKGPLSDIVISGNTITNIKNPGEKTESSPSDHTCGINIWDGAEGVLISNNTISDIKYNGIILEGASDVQIENNTMITECESGIRLEPRGGAISNIQIEENDITECEYGISVVPEAFTLSGLTINLNNFADNAIQILDDAEVLDIQGVLDTNDFDRAVTVDQTGFSLLHTIWSSIQDGINAASSDDTVKVAAGTYDESVTIGTNNLTITGDVSRPAITGGLKFDTDLTGLTLENFYVTGTVDPAKNSIVRMYGAITDLTVDNCVFDGEDVADRHGFSGGQLEDNVSITGSEFKNILGWALLDSRSGSGGDGSAMGTVTFANNNVHDCDGSVVFRGLSTDWTDNVYIYENTFQNIGEAGVSKHWAAFEVNRAENVEIHDNQIRNVVENSWGEGQAMQLWMVGTVDIYANTIENNYQGIAFLKWPAEETYDISNISIYNNSFCGNNQYALSVEDGLTGGSLNAENNYWGHATGADHADNPHDTGQGGDVVSGTVDFIPWYATATTTPDSEYVSVDHTFSSIIAYSDTIQGGIDAALSGDTVSVAAGTYKEHIIIDKSNLKLIGEDKETTIIDATQDSSWTVAKPGILIGEYPLVDDVHGVTVSGFTIKDAAMQEGGVPYEGEKYGVGPQALAGILIYNSSSNAIENNILDNNYWQIFVCAEWPAAKYTECKSNRIAYNIIMDSEQDGVYLYSDGGVYVENTEIVSNEISNVYGEQASGVEFWGWPEGGDTPTISGTVVEGNLITGCTYGVRIRDDVSDITGTSVNYNDFVDNTNYGIYNGVASTIDAIHNWWGHPSGPSCELSNGKWVGKGDKVSDNVNYKPWLHKSKEKVVPKKKPAYARSVVLDNTGDYGWNTFSAPIFLDDEADIWEELYSLAELDYSMAYRFDSDIQEFVLLTTTDDYVISPGEGFFIKMNDVGCLTILYSTEENLTPPSRPLTAGWNLIGLASLEDMNVDDAFASIATAPGLAGYSQVVSPIGNVSPGAVLADGTIYVGESYWVYMLGARTLAGFTMTPVEWVP